MVLWKEGYTGGYSKTLKNLLLPRQNFGFWSSLVRDIENSPHSAIWATPIPIHISGLFLLLPRQSQPTGTTWQGESTYFSVFQLPLNTENTSLKEILFNYYSLTMILAFYRLQEHMLLLQYFCTTMLFKNKYEIT